MSLILGILLTAAAAIAGTLLCPSPPSSNRNRVPGLALALAATLALAGRPAEAGDLLQGRATVVDGSTLVVGGVPVTLSGIVAPARIRPVGMPTRPPTPADAAPPPN